MCFGFRGRGYFLSVFINVNLELHPLQIQFKPEAEKKIEKIDDDIRKLSEISPAVPL